MVTVAASLLAATAVKQTRNKRLRNDRIKKSVWVRQRLLTRDKYGMYEKLIKHLKQGDVKSFRNFVRMDPDLFNQMVTERPETSYSEEENQLQKTSACWTETAGYHAIY